MSGLDSSPHLLPQGTRHEGFLTWLQSGRTAHTRFNKFDEDEGGDLDLEEVEVACADFLANVHNKEATCVVHAVMVIAVGV